MSFFKEQLKKEFEIFINDTRSANLFPRIFWFSVCVVGIPIVCFNIPFQYLFIPTSVSILLKFLILCCIPKFIQKIRSFKIHRSPSGVFYLYWAIFLSPLELCFFLIHKGFDVSHKDFLISLGVLFVGALVNIFIIKERIKPFDRFSSEAVGASQDKYGVAESASNNAMGILRLKKHVSVVSLNADTGYGKSSFVRMMIESIEQKEILYTYISLTETNDSADFSHLFTERWLETLNERYPRLINSPNFHLELLSDILRDNKEYFFVGVLLKWLQGVDFPLFQTNPKAVDPFLNSKSSVSGKVSRMFGGIPDIKEKKWIIVIDDFERSPIDEIYRVIQIIERFKFEGRNGLPIQLVFLLCFAGTSLKMLLNVEEKNKETDLAFLVDQFLLSDKTKSVDKSINLPPTSTAVLKQYIIDRANNFLAQI